MHAPFDAPYAASGLPDCPLIEATLTTVPGRPVSTRARANAWVQKNAAPRLTSSTCA